MPQEASPSPATQAGIEDQNLDAGVTDESGHDAEEAARREAAAAAATGDDAHPAAPTPLDVSFLSDELQHTIRENPDTPISEILKVRGESWKRSTMRRDQHTRSRQKEKQEIRDLQAKAVNADRWEKAIEIPAFRKVLTDHINRGGSDTPLEIPEDLFLQEPKVAVAWFQKTSLKKRFTALTTKYRRIPLRSIFRACENGYRRRVQMWRSKHAGGSGI